MFNRYFQQELANLKDLGAEFSKRHPAVAPMLSGLSTDPDVERLLEGVAFLTGLLRQKLDDDFPEIVHELFQLIWPHYLRPIPATSVVAFTPKSTLKHTLRVEKGTQLASVPVDGTSCLFRTCSDVDVHPLSLSDVALEEHAGRSTVIRLSMEINGIDLDSWQADRLRFYLGGDHSRAADTYLLLQRYLDRIVLTSDSDARACVLPASALKTAGFGADENLLPYPSQSFPGYRVLQEFFVLPEKYLFLELTGLSQWQQRGGANRFDIRFELKRGPIVPPRLRTKDIVLFATPVINIFAHEADPIRLDHRQSEYRIRPAGGHASGYQVYSVDAVTGFVQGTAQERSFTPFELFAPNPEATPVYHTRIHRSPVRSGFDFDLSVSYPETARMPAAETLSIQLQCTNGFLPEGLQVGDICQPTSSSPEFVDFSNIRPPTSNILPPTGQNLLWRLLSHWCLNYRSLASAENLKALLALYNFEENRDRPAYLAHQKRIEGIQKVSTTSTDRLVNGVIMRGRQVRIEVTLDHYAGLGDLYLFGCMLDVFLATYASINTFTQLIIFEMLKGEEYTWPARIGEQQLL